MMKREEIEKKLRKKDISGRSKSFGKSKESVSSSLPLFLFLSLLHRPSKLTGHRRRRGHIVVWDHDRRALDAKETRQEAFSLLVSSASLQKQCLVAGRPCFRVLLLSLLSPSPLFGPLFPSTGSPEACYQNARRQRERGDTRRGSQRGKKQSTIVLLRFFLSSSSGAGSRTKRKSMIFPDFLSELIFFSRHTRSDTPSRCTVRAPPSLYHSPPPPPRSIFKSRLVVFF
jgi:hypothetical protein